MTAEIIHVWVLEDVDAYRESLELLFQSEPGMDCPASFSTVEAALKKLETGECPKPNVLLLDIGLPGLSGLDGIPAFLEVKPDLLILVLTVFEDREKVLGALSRGAIGYLLKSADSSEIIRAVKEVVGGGSPLTPKIARYVLSTLSAPKSDESGLSARETEILTCLADGLTKKEVADQLNISYHTVDYHVRNIYKKLHVNNLAGAVVAARMRPKS